MASTTWASLGRRTEGQSCKDTSDSTRGVCRRAAQHHAVELGRRATDWAASAKPPLSTNTESGKSRFSRATTS